VGKTQNVLLHLNCNINDAKTPQCYVTRLVICYCRLQVFNFPKDLLASIIDFVLNSGNEAKRIRSKGTDVESFVSVSNLGLRTDHPECCHYSFFIIYCLLVDIPCCLLL
jgi:hypothetical protein